MTAKELVQLELPLIRKIMEDEAWLESQRRGEPVSSTDPAVNEHAAQTILIFGEQLRREAERIAALRSRAAS